MIIDDAEYQRIYWTDPQILRAFGNGLPEIAFDGDDPYPFFDDPLLPHHTFLTFHKEFITACMEDPVDSLGTYCNGWQL